MSFSPAMDPVSEDPSYIRHNVLSSDDLWKSFRSSHQIITSVPFSPATIHEDPRFTSHETTTSVPFSPVTASKDPLYTGHKTTESVPLSPETVFENSSIHLSQNYYKCLAFLAAAAGVSGDPLSDVDHLGNFPCAVRSFFVLKERRTPTNQSAFHDEFAKFGNPSYQAELGFLARL